MEYSRICPSCNNKMIYKTRDGYLKSSKNNVSCKSCCTKKSYQINPQKNKGKNNGRTGKKTIDIFIKKYGECEGIEKYNDHIKKVSQHGFKKGEENISYGKVPKNTGWSYKGWYKNLFFRSSFEIMFIIDFEKKYNRLPLSAEGTFKIKYDNQSKTYHPDFFDPLLNTLFEIKAKVFLASNVAKFEAANLFAKENGLIFQVITEDQLDYKESRIIWQLKKWQENNVIKLTEISARKLNERILRNNKNSNSYKNRD